MSPTSSRLSTEVLPYSKYMEVFEGLPFELEVVALGAEAFANHKDFQFPQLASSPCRFERFF